MSTPAACLAICWRSIPSTSPVWKAYKNNMYALLGKPGYEDRKAELEARL
ncbi:MAG: hypothetical protein ACLRWQ_06520 [Flavonifractor plautii]